MACSYSTTVATNEWQLRASKIREHLDIAHGSGLEIGPLFLPLVTKDEGRVSYADYKSQADLIAHYRQDPSFPVDDIVPVDYVLAGTTLPDAVGPDTRFDYVVASHVIEHCPDVIGWLRQIASLLRPGGMLALAVPDKRFTFDYFRRSSTAGDLIEAFLYKLSHPSPKQIIDHYENAAVVDTSTIWSGVFDEGTFQRHSTLEQGFKLAQSALSDGLYVEVHSYVFTPSSFLDIVQGLFALDLLPYRIRAFHETWRGSNEFVVTLEKLADDLDGETRRALQMESVPASTRFPSESFYYTNESGRRALDGEVPRLKRLLAEKEAEAVEARTRCSDVEHRLEAVLASNSWVMTAPLRRVRELFKRS